LHGHRCSAALVGGTALGDRYPKSTRSRYGELLRAAALAGEGIILEPTFIVGEDLAQGSLVPLLSGWEIPQASAMAVYPSRRYVSAKVRTFVEFLQQAFAGDPPWDKWMG
jgi:DNA-binding transcriptional LysR family regulator